MINCIPILTSSSYKTSPYFSFFSLFISLHQHHNPALHKVNHSQRIIYITTSKPRPKPKCLLQATSPASLPRPQLRPTSLPQQYISAAAETTLITTQTTRARTANPTHQVRQVLNRAKDELILGTGMRAMRTKSEMSRPVDGIVTEFDIAGTI